MSSNFSDTLSNSSVGRTAHNAWLFVLVLGLVAIAAGAAVLAWPGQTLLVLGVFFGIYLLVSGIVEVVLGFAPHLSGGARILSIVTGIISVVLAVLCFRDRFESVLLLATWIGVGWLISGIGKVVGGFTSSVGGGGWSVVLGLVLALGGVALIIYPVDSIATLALISGFWLIVIGISEVIDAIQIKNKARHVAAAFDS